MVSAYFRKAARRHATTSDMHNSIACHNHQISTKGSICQGVFWLRKAICLIMISVLIAALSLAAPSPVEAEMAAPGPSSPMKFDDSMSVGSGGKALGKPVTGSKWALVIGIADYQGTSSDLWHPDEDAKEMYTELTRQQGYPKANVKLLTNRAATATAIASAIDWLVASEKAGNEVVFFYSGHGSRISDADEWDADVEADGYNEMIVSYDFYGLTDGWLKQKFAAIESTKFALMFGSCHSGGMFDDNDDLQGVGRVIVSACKADQYGWDYLALGNTLWGYHFVDEALLDNRAGSTEAAHSYAYPLVTAQQPDSQPQLYDNYAGDFTL